jgi:hypothetical protein
MKDTKDMNLKEVVEYYKEEAQTSGMTELADRLDTLLFEQAQRHDAWVDALENKINSLEAERRWIPVEERLPTKEDADKYGEVMWLYRKDGAVIAGWGVYRDSVYVTHWKRITPLEDK